MLIHPVRLAVLGLALGGATLALAGGPPGTPPTGNVNVITNTGNGRSNTLIVEGGKSTFIRSDAPQATPMAEAPMPVVPAVPATTDQPPMQPVEPQPQPMPQPQPQPMPEPAPVPVPEIVVRIPVPQIPVGRGPVIEIPGLRLPQVEIPAIRVPAEKALILNNPGGGRTMIYSSGGVGNTSIVTGGGQTVVVGDGLVYKGRDNRFWTKSMFSKEVGATVYYDPRTTLWFRYVEREDAFRPVPQIDTDDD